MPSVYLSEDDLTTYGVPSATADQITQASALLNAYLRRPEGLVWSPDGNGAPCFMAGALDSFKFTLAGAITPGSNVVAQMNGPVSMLQVGEVLVMDRATAAKTEACIVGAVDGNNVTLQSVTFEHDANSLGEMGLLIEEQRYTPDDRPIIRVSRTPLARILSGVGRYGYSRRGGSARIQMEEFNLLAELSKFGGPPAWEIFAPVNAGIDAQTGQVWLPAGILLAYYTEVKVRYVAGFSAEALPPEIKLACAGIVKAAQAQAFPPGTKMYQAGDTKIENFVASILDQDILTSLQSFAARSFY